MKRKVNKIILANFLFLLFFFVATINILNVVAVPSQINLNKGKVYKVKIPNNIFIKYQLNDKGKNLRQVENKINSNDFKLLFTEKIGQVPLQLKMFGILPVKSVSLNVVNTNTLTVVGKTVGVRLKTAGVLVASTSEIIDENENEVFPAKEAGIKVGDLIIELNKNKVNSSKEIQKIVAEGNQSHINVTFLRNNIKKNSVITPVKSFRDHKFYLGLWCRDYISGIGTLTYYDGKYVFGALGHSVSENSENSLIPILGGEILKTDVRIVSKGEKGKPGEMCGDISDDSSVIGEVYKNCNEGIFGKLDELGIKYLEGRRYPIGFLNDISDGKAMIVNNIDGQETHEYQVEIKRNARSIFGKSKSLYVKIIDKKLLSKTGGIIQGMSGSPIIQNGKIVGVVTHVLINDPTVGFGTSIDKLLETSDKIS